jgi:hypothetical protein
MAATSISKCALAAAALFALSAVHAVEIYRWVDENGRTQISDHVPEKFRAGATPLGDSRQYELTPRQRAEAEARTAREKRQREIDEQDRADAEKAAQEAARAAAAAASAATTTRRPRQGTVPGKIDAAECAALQAEYAKSGACYAPFHLARGGLRAGAFDACGPTVPDPSERCGPEPAAK